MAGDKEAPDQSCSTDNGLTSQRELADHKTKPMTSLHKTPSRADLFLITLFAILGRCTAIATRVFLAAFYIDFLKEKNLDKTIGK